MSDVKRLLSEATPLPWELYDGPRPGIDGPEGMGDSIVVYGGEYEGDYAGVNTAENAALIVYAVNHLPDYLAAVNLLSAIVSTWDEQAEDTIGENVLALAPLIFNAREPLRRLREKVPA